MIDNPNLSIDYQKSNILIAEDEDINYDYLYTILKKLEINLTRAKNGKDAVELAQKNNYDLILMDLKMPIMDGFEAVKKSNL